MMPINVGKCRRQGHHQADHGKYEIRQHLAELGFVDSDVTVVSEIDLGTLILQVKDSRIAIERAWQTGSFV